MTEAKDLELEISTEGARSLLEIGFDLGVEAMRGAFCCCSSWCQGVCKEDTPVNPFRRASTEIIEPTDFERFEARTHRAGQTIAQGEIVEAAAKLTAQSVPELIKQIERVEADAEANARAQASAEQAERQRETEYWEACAIEEHERLGSPPEAPLLARPHVMCWGTYWTQDGNEPCSLRAGHDGAHR